MSHSTAGRFILTVACALLPSPVTVGADKPAPTIDEIQRVIRESEYHVTWQDQTVLPDLEAAWHAANRSQNLRFYFTVDGLRVADRTANGNPELVRLRVALPSRQTIVSSSTLERTGNGVVVRRDGLTERFVNSERGLEHVITIGGTRSRLAPMTIELDFVSAGLNVTADSVELRTTTGRRLTYSIGEVLDASGEPVSAELGLVDGRLLISVAKSDPVMPVTVKNLLTGAANTVLQSNVVDQFLGKDVSAGDVNGDGFSDVVVGAPGWDGGQTDEGAVLVFHGGPGGIASNGAGALVPNAIIESDLAGFQFPTSLAVIGDVNGDGFDDIAAGETRWDPVNPPSTTDVWGAVWVFEGSVQGISATSLNDAETQIVSNVLGAAFGVSVNSAGDVNGDGFTDLIAGGWLWSDDVAEPNEGAGFIFHGSSLGISATSITHAATVLEGNGADLWSGMTTLGLGDVNGDGFDDVAVDITSLDNPELNEGGIAILHGGLAGIPGNPTQALAAAADSLIEANLVYSYINFAGAGDVNGDGYADLILGMPLWEDSGPHADEGVMLIYHGGPSGISSNQSASVTVAADTVIEGNPSPHGSIEFGNRVAGIGDVNGDGFSDVVVGADRFANGEVDEGALFVFHGREGGILNSRTDPVEEVADNVIEGNAAGLFLGGTRPAAGDVNGDGYSDLVAPAPQYAASEHAEGAVFIYHGGADVLALEADTHHDFSVAGAAFGSPARNAGDLNGDGFSDVAVGAPFHDVLSSREGSVHVFFGSTDPSLSSPDWSFDGQDPEGWTGVGVASAGDLNGDGFGDLVVGTPNASNPEIDEGRVDVFYGSAGGLSSSPDWSYEANLDDAGFGRAVSTAGDIDGDGYGDLIVGAPDYSNGQSTEGRAYVFFGSSMGLPSNPGWTYENDVASANLGFAVASAGDVNGDGFGDVIIGAWGYTSGESDEGAAYCFYGSESGLPAVPNWFIQTNRVTAYYGISVAGVGDVNGDGFSDVIVGAPYDTNGENQEGRAYVYHGSSGGLSTSANQVLEENIADAGFGVNVAAAGDVNGDGFSDVMVGSPFVGVPGSFDGRAYLYLGTATGVGSDPGWLMGANGTSELLGHSAAGAGDVNGDGFSDVVIGSPGSDAGAVYGGSVELYLGNAGSGRPVLARQFRGAGDPTPVQPWGLTNSGDDFQISMTATSPRGRELVKLHVEACPPGEVWGDVDCRHVVSADWMPIPLGENGIVLNQTLSGLTEDVLYHWRAHVLYVPLHADEPGITTPPVPRHGPWRTLFAAAPAADIRVGEPQRITIEMVSASSSEGEGAPQAEVSIVMTTSDGEVSEVDTSVDFTTWDGSALAGHDFVHTSFNRFFPAGTTNGAAQIIAVNLINDDLDEPDEDFSVEIYNPMGAVLGFQMVHTVTIVDDDPPPELSAMHVEVDEGAGLAVVVLELSGATSFEVTVDYASVDGSAAAPLDYGPVSGTATIQPMDTIFNIDIPIEEDWIEEGDETFNLNLSGPSNTTLTTSTVLVTIVDNDAGILFADGFESGDTGRWTSVKP